MLEPLLKERSKRLIDSRISGRTEQLNDEIERIGSEAASRGMIDSNIYLSNILKAHTRELQIRTTIAWECILRVHRILGSPLSESIREDLKHLIKFYINSFTDELSSSLKRYFNNPFISHSISHLTSYEEDFEEQKNECMTKHEIEIDLYIDSLQLTLEKGENIPSHQYNIYGPVGAVQTGQYASANIVQNLGSEDKEALVEALGLVKEQMVSKQDLSEMNRQELKEIVTECIDLIKNPKSNNTKLLTLLNTLSTTIQAYAGASPAYNALKNALLPLGIMLP